MPAQANYEFQNIFKNKTLNTIALEIRDEVGELLDAMDTISNESDAMDMKLAQDTIAKSQKEPISFIKDLMNRNIEKLDKIKNQVGSDDINYLDLSNGLLFAVIGLIALPIYHLKVRTDPTDFISHINVDEIEKIKTDILELDDILNRLKKMPLNDLSQKQIVQLQQILKTL